MMMSRLTSSSSRVSVGLRPIIAESVGSEPGPTPSIVRPRVRWSRSTIRSATHSGLWYGDRRHAGAELDVAGALGRGGDEDLRRGDDLAAGRVVLADPGLVVARGGRGAGSARGLARAPASGSRPAGWNGARKMPKRILPISASPRGPVGPYASPALRRAGLAGQEPVAVDDRGGQVDELAVLRAGALSQHLERASARRSRGAPSGSPSPAPSWRGGRRRPRARGTPRSGAARCRSRSASRRRRRRRCGRRPRAWRPP